VNALQAEKRELASRYILHLNPKTLNPEPKTLNPKPLNPKL